MISKYKNLEYINGYKLMLCIIVIIGHFYNYIGGRTIWKIRLIGGMGAKACDAFFFISGFLVLYSTVQKKIRPYESLRDLWLYYKKKLMRLYPVYIIAIGIGVICARIFSIIHLDILLTLTGGNVGAFNVEYGVEGFPSFGNILAHIFMAHGIFYQYRSGIVGLAWYMGVEVLCIIFSPFILWLINIKNNWKPIIVKVVWLSFMIVGLCISIEKGTTQTFFRNFPLFFGGVLFGQAYESAEKKNIRLIVSITCIYLMFLDYKQNWLSCFFIVFLTLLITLGESNKVLLVVKRLLENKRLHFLSHSTYELYMFHEGIIPISFAIPYYLFHQRGMKLCVLAGVILFAILVGLAESKVFISRLKGRLSLKENEKNER